MYGNVDEASKSGPSMQEDYVQQPSPSRQQTADSACKGGALGPLPDGYPAPLSRLVVKNLKLLITLNQEMPSHADGASLSNAVSVQRPYVQHVVCFSRSSAQKVLAVLKIAICSFARYSSTNLQGRQILIYHNCMDTSFDMYHSSSVSCCMWTSLHSPVPAHIPEDSAQTAQTAALSHL